MNEKNEIDENSEKSVINEEQLQARANLDTIIPDTVALDEAEAEAEAAPAAASAVDSLYGLLSLVPIGLSFAGLKNTANVWSESTCQGLANACVPVFRKYAWGQKIIVFLETGGGIEELALMAVVMPIGLATYKAYSADTKPIDDADSAALKPNPARVDYDDRN